VTDPPANRERERTATLRTFLIADVRGYTRFTQEHGDEEGATLARRFAVLARRGITDHEGELVELRGDEALGAFGSARDALRAAVELQRLFRTSSEAGPALPLGVGIGIDAGEAVPVENGYRGGALNLAARLCTRARDGEILASATVVSLARRVGGMRFEYRGAERFKGFDEPVRVIEVVPLTPLPPLPAVRLAWLRRFRRRHLTRRNLAAVALVALVSAAAAGAVVAFGAASTAVPGVAGAGATRVALVLPREPSTSEDVFAPYVEGLLEAKRRYGVETQTLVVDPSQRTVGDGVRKKLQGVDLVLLGGPAVHDMFVNEVPRQPDTAFAFIDPTPRWDETQIHQFSNTADIFFIEGPASYLAGYIGALMEKRRGTDRVVASVVAGDPIVNENLVAGFRVGVRKAVPGATILTDYSQTLSNPSVCEAIANRQIDRGSRVVFAPAGACGLGALSAASVRGVWAIGVGVDRAYLGSHILVSIVKRFDRAVEFAVRSFLDGKLEGRSLDIGIEREAVGIVGISPEVPSAIRRKVAAVAQRGRKEWASWSTP
jgi:basic membrane protein A and related proteins